MLSPALALALAALSSHALPDSNRIDPSASVRIDSSRHELVVTAGPFNLPNMPPSPDGIMDHGAAHDTPVHRFSWPVDGWLRGFRIEVLDARGNPLPRSLMHHLVILNYDRRQLVYSAAERLFGAGTETEDASVPRSIGVPLKANTNLGMYVAWHNESGKEIVGVTLRLTMQWMPKSQNPRPIDVLPMYMDVNLTVGGTNTFDVPPGRSTKSYEFTLPVSGRLLGVSGHIHNYGEVVRLEDVETGKVLTKVEPTLDDNGNVVKMGRELFGVRGNGLRLRAGHRYRVVAEYNNTTGQTLHNGGMAHMVGLFAPDDVAKWPQVDPRDPIYEKDIMSLEMRGTSGMGEMHHH
ncbi:MAG: hypothetical protein ABI679_04810 [Gemmatimonadota bacterium]